MRRGASQLRELADFSAGLSLDDVPKAACDQAVVLILDTLAVMLSGAVRPEMQRLVGELPAGTDAQVVAPGLPRSTSTAAAVANGTAGSFLELDQGERPTGHPALHGLPPLLAHAQARHLSGRDLLTAFIVHYEIQARIQRAFALRWPIHPHGTFGTPAAAAGLGKLDGADATTLVALICGGASLAAAPSWSSCIEGATVRNAYAALTAQTAFLVRALVSSGFTASDNAVDEMFGQLIGEEVDHAALGRDLGERFAVTGGYVKFHAACALTHPALDAVVDGVGAVRDKELFPPFRLVRTFRSAEVERVRVRTTERAARLGRAATDNELAAKFSIPAAVATLLVHGTSEPASFREDALARDDVRELAARVEVEADEGLTAAWPTEFRAEVEIDLADGARIEGECVNPYGSNANPASREAIRAKFDALVGGVIGSDRAAGAWEAGSALAEVDDCDRFLDACFGVRAR